MNIATPYLRLAALAALTFVQFAPQAQSAPPPELTFRPAPAAVDAAGKSCADKWRDYRRSVECFAHFRNRHVVSPEALQRCGPPVKEPVDCPRS